MSPIHAKDVGIPTTIVVVDDDGPIDISTSSVHNITFRNPNGTTITREGTFVASGIDGALSYTPVTGDDVFARSGRWYQQAYIEIDGKIFRSAIEPVDVEEILTEDPTTVDEV